jgi:hypothetical protein
VTRATDATSPLSSVATNEQRNPDGDDNRGEKCPKGQHEIEHCRRGKDREEPRQSIACDESALHDSFID